eukprot:GHUV01051139.1.p2 GENE.GHUV01051139.1~~GHUV01051139.1.p2  ORF type:complete len:139 (+),score=40.21 GHUV01051139.1:249-665(+)
MMKINSMLLDDPTPAVLSVLQPAMDVYSLGVLLFIMLVGRKPWDAQRSHTLQYAVEATADAPGLQDQVFTALSPAAQQLVILMLAEDPGDRPSAGQVVNHAWMLQGIKVRLQLLLSDDHPATKATSCVCHPEWRDYKT